MSNGKILEVLKDEEFIKKILETPTQDEVQHAFKEKGVEISKEEIGILGDIINKMKEKNSTSLTEELNEIAGGGQAVDDFVDGLLSPIYGARDAIKGVGVNNYVTYSPTSAEIEQGTPSTGLYKYESTEKRGGNKASIAGTVTGAVALTGGLLTTGITLGTLGTVLGSKAVKWAKSKVAKR